MNRTIDKFLLESCKLEEIFELHKDIQSFSVIHNNPFTQEIIETILKLLNDIKAEINKLKKLHN